jgi:hypothetical protein
MENKIYVKEKISYGQVRYYPDCYKSKMFASLTRKKTLELLELQEISGILGFDVVRRIYDDVNDVTYNIRMIEKGKELVNE